MMRKDNRLAIENAWLQLQRIQTGSGTHSRYQVYNISRGGLRFSSTETFETQERINITLHLPNNTEHRSLGRICYCEADTETKVGNYYGVSFLENFLDMTPFQ